jgi:hypothetical protein
VLLFAAAALLIPTLSPELQAQEPKTLSGVIVDADSGEPVLDVLLRIDDSGFRAVSDSAGRFRMEGIPPGSHRLVLSHIAYGEHSRPLTLSDTATADFLIRISRQAIELEPIEVVVLSDAERARRASGNSIDLIERPTIDAFASRGVSLVNLLASEVPGIRVNGPCVEFRLQERSRGIGVPDPDNIRARDPVNRSCRELTVYVDGVRVLGSSDLQTIPLQDLERVEVLSPGEAGVRFGSSGGTGVILLETRQGIMSDASAAPATRITGFGWSEPRPYPWVRVVGASLAGVALNVGLVYAGLNKCVEPDESDISPYACGGMIAAAAGMMTGTVSGLITTWAGTTGSSRGRTFPSLAAGVLSAVTGYVLLLNGENHDSDVSRTAGLAVLTVGTPVMLTLTNRVFRQVR